MDKEVQISCGSCQPTSTEYLGMHHVSNATADTEEREKLLSVASDLSMQKQNRTSLLQLNTHAPSVQ
jgi:hypothetical protein